MSNTLHMIKMTWLMMFLLSIALLHAEESVASKDWSVSSVSEDPKLAIIVRGYPDTIQFGDSIYLICIFKNVGEQAIEEVTGSYQGFFVIDRRRHFQLALMTSDSVENIYENFPEDDGGKPQFVMITSRSSVPFLPGESRMVYVHTFEFPPLEDIRHPFWREISDELGTDGVTRTMRFTTKKTDSRDADFMERTLYHDILIKPRSEQEMNLLNQWFDKSAKEHLPVTGSAIRSRPSFKFPFPSNDRFSFGSGQFSADDGNRIVIRGTEYNPWVFLRIGNRKPPAHLAPQTWQGWKELEDSLAPSTMRDEIRLTRILIQYCDTEDSRVLDELKEWFAGMNEVQRTVMARCLRNRMSYAFHELAPRFRDIYETVREYDITVQPQRN